MEYFVQQLINGVTLGSIYGLIAIGYTMVYGIIGMINFAHGDIFMIGAFSGLIVIVGLGALGFGAAGVMIILALLAAMAIAGAYGWALERVAYRPLRGSFRLAALISAIGMVWASMLAFACLAFLMKTRHPKAALAAAVATPLLLYAFFAHVAGVAVPQGDFIRLP